VTTTPLRDDEVEALISYLRSTPVWPLADDLARRDLVASRDLLRTRAALASATTIFRTLGGLYASVLHGRDNFRVSDVWPVLSRFDCDDPETRSTVEAMVAAEKEGRLSDRLLTVLEDKTSRRLVDGNKRAVAIYEAAVAKMPLPIVVLARLAE
jgi:hypothetical protein